MLYFFIVIPIESYRIFDVISRHTIDKQTTEKITVVIIILQNIAKISKKKLQVKTYLHLINYPNVITDKAANPHPSAPYVILMLRVALWHLSMDALPKYE